jgi:hypothetical protein
MSKPKAPEDLLRRIAAAHAKLIHEEVDRAPQDDRLLQAAREALDDVIDEARELLGIPEP